MGVGETDAFPAAGSVVPGIYRDLNACLCTNLMLYLSHTCKFISNLFMTQRKWKLYWNNNKKVHTIGSRAPDIKHKFICKWQKPWDSRKIKMAFKMEKLAKNSIFSTVVLIYFYWCELSILHNKLLKLWPLRKHMYPLHCFCGTGHQAVFRWFSRSGLPGWNEGFTQVLESLVMFVLMLTRFGFKF